MSPRRWSISPARDSTDALSSLIFVPLFGTAFLFLHAYGWPAKSEESVPSRPMDRR